MSVVHTACGGSMFSVVLSGGVTKLYKLVSSGVCLHARDYIRNAMVKHYNSLLFHNGILSFD